MFNFQNIICVKLKSNSGKKLTENQLVYIAQENDISYEFLKLYLDEGYQKIYFEKKDLEDKIIFTPIAFFTSDQLFFFDKFKKIPEILKAQISIIESVKIPKATVNLKKPKSNNKLVKENEEIIVTATVDELLDKINKKGIQSLTTKEIETLKVSSGKQNVEEKDTTIHLQNDTKIKIRPHDNSPVSLDKFNFEDNLYRIPSIDELVCLYKLLHINGEGNFKNGIYWSSTEFEQDKAWFIDFETGKPGTALKKFTANVRLVQDIS